MIRKALILLLLMTGGVMANAQKYVGGDLSLVPAYETAGDVWLDADGNAINTKYQDGMITYVKEVAGWNAVRVRLLVDPSQDDAPATCQDLEYVKKLGKRIKDAGMSFLLDIFYSDTWTDVTGQWIPASWGYNRNTETATLATKVKSYTTEVLNALVSYGATPDFIQIGNEVSYGMLWDSKSGGSKNNWFIFSKTYEQQSAQIIRFATLLKAAAEGVRASNCSTAKIVLHCERTLRSDDVKSFYTWVEKAGFTDYDIIGLSYYPLWHGTLKELASTLSTLQTSFPSKKVQLVEVGYYNTSITPASNEYNTSSTWPYTPAGQASFLADLIAKLNDYSNVTGLYYWQPEECGNGADDDGTKRVMGDWDKRGFWQLTWKSSEGPHKLISEKALMTLNTFIGGSGYQGSEEDESDVTDKYITNPRFDSNINGWSNANGTAQWKQNTWGVLSNYCEFAWTGSAIINQEVVQTPTLPAGSYKLSINCATDNGATGVFLIANGKSQEMIGTGNVESFFVEFNVTSEGPVKLGVKLENTTATWINFDNFRLEKTATSGIVSPLTSNPSPLTAYYTLDGRKLTDKPTTRGIYIYNGKKIIIP